MNFRPLMTVRVVAAPAQQIGATPQGLRRVVPVVGGDFDGPQLRGKVLSGGADWLLLRPDGVLELDLRVTLETVDQELIYLTFQGLRHGSPKLFEDIARGVIVDPKLYYFRTLPRFETSSGKYAFLNRIIAIDSGETNAHGAVHRIEEVL
jgi:hypothetical protein